MRETDREGANIPTQGQVEQGDHSDARDQAPLVDEVGETVRELPLGAGLSDSVTE